MLERLLNPVNQAAQVLDRKLAHKAVVAIVVVVFAAVLKIASLQIGITRFSPDSWSYFELSKTIFGPAFYQFNTFRSYFSHEYSASFPPGYPTVLAIASWVFGERPMTAVDINIAAAVATGWVLLGICRTLRLSALTSLAIVCSVWLYPPYLDEVVSGRAVPAALLVFLVSFHLQLQGKALAAGCMLGLSVLFRFDFLVYALLYQAIVVVRNFRDPQAVIRLALGFAAGISPWVIYSVTHFGRMWVSDNSWVALSAVPAFVVDYPAAPLVSAFEAPMAWLRRVLGNVQPLLQALGGAALLMPLLVVFLVASIRNWRQVTNKSQVLALVLAAAASTAPYLLTGYFDARYFSLVFLGLALLQAVALSAAPRPCLLGLDLLGLGLVALVMTIPVGLSALGTMALQAPQVSQRLDLQTRQIATLKACHQKTPRTIYIFIGDVFGFAPMYGGLSGMRTAFVASNYPRMTDGERQAFFDHLQPHLVIRSMEQIEQCHQQN
ncbi:MAG: hypothetical protein V4679_20810 [Pseudomonadota bacterium]